jgi:hypothetical protein
MGGGGIGPNYMQIIGLNHIASIIRNVEGSVTLHTYHRCVCLVLRIFTY